MSDTPWNSTDEPRSNNYTTTKGQTSTGSESRKGKEELTRKSKEAKGERTSKGTSAVKKEKSTSRKAEKEARKATEQEKRAGARQQAGDAACRGELPPVTLGCICTQEAAPAEPRTRWWRLQKSRVRDCGGSRRAANETTAAPTEPRTKLRRLPQSRRRDGALARSGDSNTRVRAAIRPRRVHCLNLSDEGRVHPPSEGECTGFWV